MSLLGALQGRRKNRRMQKQLHKALLVFDGQVNELGFVDGPVCDLLSSGHHKIADTAALQFRGTPDDPKRTGRNASFDTRGAAGLLGHGGDTPKQYCTGFCLTMQRPKLSQRGRRRVGSASGAGGLGDVCVLIGPDFLERRLGTVYPWKTGIDCRKR